MRATLERLGLYAGVFVLLGVSAWLTVRALRDDPLDGPPTRSDSLRSELLISQLEEKGFVVTTAAGFKDLTARAQKGDSLDPIKRELAAAALDVETLGGRVQSSAEMEARLRAQLLLQGEVFASARDSLGNISGNITADMTPDSVRWKYSDSTFVVDAKYRPPGALELDLAATIRAGLLWTTTPDRRLIVSAVASDPRVSLFLSDAAYQLSETGKSCGFWCSRKKEVVTIAKWEVGKAIVRAVIK